MKKSDFSLKRISLWIMVILYTASLPEFIRLYEWIVHRSSAQFVANLPLILVVILLFFFALYFLRAGKGARGIISLFLCICVAAAIFRIVEIPNKRIHIPEYILMCWLVFAALKQDYRGRGGVLLVLVLSSLLGVVDEVVQGFRPLRYYGYPDMVVNSLSSLMGVLLLTASGKSLPSDGKVEIQWKAHWAALMTNAAGASGAFLSCYYLGTAAAHNTFFISFPTFVIVWNSIGSTAIILVIFCSTAFPRFRKWYVPSSHPAAILWLFLPQATWLIIMGLTVTGYFLGLGFR